MSKKIYSLLLVLALALPLPALAQGVVVTDGAARTVTVPLHARAVVLLGSYAQAYVQAGGQLLAATEDYFMPGRIAM
jgi:ABC-type Fe3+-hydroxamate transport system substrate-binding protein